MNMESRLVNPTCMKSEMHSLVCTKLCEAGTFQHLTRKLFDESEQVPGWRQD